MQNSEIDNTEEEAPLPAETAGWWLLEKSNISDRDKARVMARANGEYALCEVCYLAGRAEGRELRQVSGAPLPPEPEPDLWAIRAAL